MGTQLMCLRGGSGRSKVRLFRGTVVQGPTLRLACNLKHARDSARWRNIYSHSDESSRTIIDEGGIELSGGFATDVPDSLRRSFPVGKLESMPVVVAVIFAVAVAVYIMFRRTPKG
jgi:hypothetical protein